MEPIFQAAITGYGKSARNFHIPLLKMHDGFKLRSVLLPAESTTQVEEDEIMVVRSLKELLKDDKLDIVIITSPNRFHFEQSKKPSVPINMYWWKSQWR
jgi:scyllo-inositol 2-dehydrogenase (NADP+)